MSAIDGAVSSQSLEFETQSESPVCMARVQVLELYPYAFQGGFARSWNGGPATSLS